MIKILVICLFYISYAIASDPWSRHDKLRHTFLTTTLLIDYSQTVYISENTSKYDETNLLLGKHPSKDKVIGYFAASSMTFLYIADKLPTKWRKVYQFIVIAFETFVISHNVRIGIKLSW